MQKNILLPRKHRKDEGKSSLPMFQNTKKNE